MKTPRLALIALVLPALLLASFAKAGPAPKADALPTWPVVDESFRAWPTIYFTVGKDNRALRCRYSECNPETNKGQSNLYVMIESGARVPIDATVYEYTPLPGWDPRSWYGSPESRYSKRPRVVKAHRQNYTTQLSNFKLDNTGGKLFAVQGGVKYAATTDIRTTYMSETGGVVAVAPPTKKAADVVKPDGSVPPVPPERRPNPTTPAQYRWCETATGNSRISPTSPGAGWTKAPTQTSTCKKPDDTRPVPPPDAASPLELSAKEKQWLTKGQAADYEEALKVGKEVAVGPEKASAMKDLVDRTRKTVTENLQPNAAAISAYTAAAAAKDATNAKIDATLPAEVWGGPNSAIVGPFGERLDIQLSKEEWTALAAPNLSAALKAYKDGRKGVDGNKDASALSAGTYSPDHYDPIKLHLVTMAARAAVGTVAKPPVTTPPVTTPPGGGTGAEVPQLTAAELELLTPAERQTYNKLLQNFKDKQPGADKALALETERLRGLIASQNRAKNPYKVPTRESFANAPDWHKDIFCDPKIAGAAAAAADTAAAGVDNNPNARRGLDNSAAAASGGTGGTTTAAGGLPDWAKGPCAMYLASKTPDTGNGGGRKIPGNGVDQDLASKMKPAEEDTVANSWFMRTQLQTALQGGLIGLVIGSLFGPIGLIAGPLIGAGLLYGMQKYDAVKADNKKKKEASAGE